MTRSNSIADQCSFCGHPRHTARCPGEIQTGTARQPNTQPCPCNNTKENTHVQHR